MKPYAVNVKFIPGSQLILADTLYRAYLSIEAAVELHEFDIHLLGS